MRKPRSLDRLLPALEQAIWDALAAILPSHWRKARLVVSHHPYASGKTQ